jgi:hypothetical protein
MKIFLENFGVPKLINAIDKIMQKTPRLLFPLPLGEG